MKRFVLKTPAKILLVLLAVAIIGVTLFKTGAFDKAKKQISSAKDKGDSLYVVNSYNNDDSMERIRGSMS